MDSEKELFFATLRLCLLSVKDFLLGRIKGIFTHFFPLPWYIIPFFEIVKTVFLVFSLVSLPLFFLIRSIKQPSSRVLGRIIKRVQQLSTKGLVVLHVLALCFASALRYNTLL